MSRNCAVILAAGEGKRMRSQKAKVLQEVLFKPMIDWVIDAARQAGIEDICVVTGHQREQVEAHLGDRVVTVVQEERLGTGHAVMQAKEWLSSFSGGNCLVLCGDAPLFSADTVRAAGELHTKNSLAATVITAVAPDPTGYGRIVRDEGGFLKEIVEHRDASDAVRAIKEINGGAYWFDVDLLLPSLSSLKNENSQGEYYLTDVPKFFSQCGKKVGAYVAPYEEIGGANDRAQLNELNEIARMKLLKAHMQNGVSIPCTDGVIIGPDVTVGADAEILTGCIITGSCSIGRGSVIGPNSVIHSSSVGECCSIRSSYVLSSALPDGASVGPFEKVENKNL